MKLPARHGLNLMWHERPFAGEYPDLQVPMINGSIGAYVLWFADQIRIIEPVVFVGKCTDPDQGIDGCLRQHLDRNNVGERALWHHLQPRLELGQQLYFSLTKINPELIDGVETYLAGMLCPAVPQPRTEVYPIPVALPPFDPNWEIFD